MINKVPRREFLAALGLAAASMTLVACQPIMPVQPIQAAEAMPQTPDEALQRLLAGNQRFAADMSKDPHQSVSRRMMVASRQMPFATILSCVDSRVPPEIVFDQGLGDLFVARSAGQVIDDAVLGSIEFGAAELHIPLIFVLGHEKCGAVKATIETLEAGATGEGAIQALVEAITPAVEKAKGQSGDLLDNAVRANIEGMVNRLKESSILSEAIASGQIMIVGGRYDLDTGMVEVTVS